MAFVKEKKISYRDMGDGTVEASGNCVFTGKEYKCTVPLEGLKNWMEGRAHIQVAMPNISADDREFLISGISPEGWKEVFG
jgi:hypothetical protein